MSTQVATGSGLLANAAKAFVRDSYGVQYVLTRTSGTTFSIDCTKYAITSGTQATTTSDIVGQSFAGTGGYLTHVSFKMAAKSSPVGTLYARIYAHTGTYGTSSIPTGSPLATATLDAANLGGSDSWNTFEFDTPFLCENGTYYVLAISSYELSSGSVDFRYYSGGSVDGNLCYSNDGGSNYTGASTGDAAFAFFFNGGSFYTDATYSSGTAIEGLSMAIDSSDVIHISWMDDQAKASKLMYTTYTISTDTLASATTIVADIGEDPATGSLYSDIAVDSNNVPHIVYTENTKNIGMTLHYVNKVGGSWNAVVDVLMTAGYDTYRKLIYIDIDNLPVLMSEVIDTTIKVYGYIGNANNATSFSVFSNIASSTSASAYPYISFAIDPVIGDVWASFLNAATGVIELRQHVYGGSWSSWESAVVNSGVTGLRPEMFIIPVSGGSDIYLIYENDSSEIAFNIYHYLTAGGSSWEGETVLQTTADPYNTPLIHNNGIWVQNDSSGSTTNPAELDYIYYDEQATPVLWADSLVMEIPTVLTAVTASFTLTGVTVTLTADVAQNLILDATGTTAFTLTGLAITYDWSFAVQVGSFTLTGLAITYDWSFAIQVGSFTLTGFDVTLTKYTPSTNYTLDATDAQTFIVTPVNIILKYPPCFTADSTLVTADTTGWTADMVCIETYTMTAVTTSFTLIGIATNFAIQRNYTFTADVSTFALTGYDVTLNKGKMVTVEAGGFTLTGISLILQLQVQMPVTVSEFSVTGYALTFDWTFAIQVGAFTLTGNDTAFAITRNYTLATDAQTFDLTGIAINFAIERHYTFTVDTVAFTLTGYAASLSETNMYSMLAENVAFTFTGNEVTFTLEWHLLASPTSFTLASSAIHFDFGYYTETGTFALTGFDVVLTKTKAIAAEVATFDLTGYSITFDRSFQTSTGVFTLTGNNIALYAGRTITIEAGTFTFTGIAINFAIQRNFTFTANVTTFTLTGYAVNLTLQGNIVMSAEVEPFTLSGLAVAWDRSFQVASSSFTLTGYDTNFAIQRNLTLTADAQTYALTGSILIFNLQGNYTLDATDVQTFVLGGYDVAFTVVRNYTLDATGSQSFPLVGYSVAFAVQHNYVFDATTAQSFSLVGLDVTLTFAEGNFNYTMQVTEGTFTLTGYVVAFSLQGNYQLVASPVSFVLNGLGIHVGLSMVATVNGFILGGQAVNFAAGRLLSVPVAGSFALTAYDSFFISDKTTTVETGAFALTGNDVTTTLQKQFAIEVTAFDLTGYDNAITKELALQAIQQVYNFVGYPVNIFFGNAQLNAETGIFVLTGFDVPATLYMAGEIISLNSELTPEFLLMSEMTPVIALDAEMTEELTLMSKLM